MLIKALNPYPLTNGRITKYDITDVSKDYMYFEQVTLHKGPETHSHVYLVTLYMLVLTPLSKDSGLALYKHSIKRMI